MKGFIALVIALMLSSFSHQLDAQIPRILSYQGVLTDTSGIPRPDGSYTLTFRLYESSSGGTAIWSETKSLQTKRGLFYATLGDQTPFADSVSFDTSYWMSIQVGSEPELSPRLLLTSVGSSISSQYAASVRDRSGEALRFVRGTVNTSGAVLAGRGFSVARNGIGDITITFSNPFSQQPTAIATSYTMFPAIPLVNNISNAIVRIVLVNTGSTPVDGVLGFVVTGPP